VAALQGEDQSGPHDGPGGDVGRLEFAAVPCLYLAPGLAEPVHRNGEILYVETLCHVRVAE
jgi:hypothetical protein